MRQLISIFILCVLFTFGVQSGFAHPAAQDAPVESPALPLVDIDGAGDQLVGVVNGIVTGGVNAAWFAPIVALLVGLLKQVPAFYRKSDDPSDTTGVSAPTLSFAVSAIVWIGAAIVTRVGIQTQVNSFMDLIVQSSPYMIGFLATLKAAPAVHEYAASVRAPIMGSKRSPEKAIVEAIPLSSLANYQPIVQASSGLDEATALRLATQAAVVALERTGFNWTPGGGGAALG